MGGMVSIVARYEDGQINAFKVHTSILQGYYSVSDGYLNTSNILKSSWLKEMIAKHNMMKDDHLSEDQSQNYDSSKGIKAPYDYGIILIDYMSGTLVSANNYCGMIMGSTASILMQYAKLVKQDFKMRYCEHNGVETLIDLKEQVFMEFNQIHFIHKALESGAIILKNEEVVYHTGTIDSVIGSIYGLKLEGLSAGDKAEVALEYIKNEPDERNENGGYDLSSYSDLTFQYPNFKFIQYNGSEEAEKVLDYMLSNDFELTPLEEETWYHYINEQI